MEVLNDYLWNTYRKAEGMGIRGNNTRQVNSTQYAPNHIKSVVKEIGLRIISESNNNLVIYCPFHNNTHSPSFYISEDNGAWLCFNPSCGETGNIIQLVKKITGKNDFESIRLVAAKEAQALDNFDETLNSVLEDKPEFIEFDQKKLDERSISEKKFKNSTNLPKNKTLFNIHRAKKIGDHVIIVESSFDAIRIHQSGFPNVVATLGGHISTDNINLLNRYFNKIIIMTDADQAGRELGISISNKLKNKDILWASYSYGKIYPHDAKDAGDMSEEEIKICIKNAVSDIEYKSWNL